MVGPDPALANLLHATGFSGHGVVHAPATGRAVADLVVHGSFWALDLTPLGFGRAKRGEPLRETAVYWTETDGVAGRAATRMVG